MPAVEDGRLERREMRATLIGVSFEVGATLFNSHSFAALPALSSSFTQVVDDEIGAALTYPFTLVGHPVA